MQLDVNGKQVDLEVNPKTPLLWVLRDHLGITSPKYGCGIAMCGACTVLVDGQAKRSCSLPVEEVKSAKVTTLEGLSGAQGLHPVQEAWIEAQVVQCGFCQPGQIMSATSLLADHPTPTPEQIDQAMSGNACRCGTYPRIREAIGLASLRINKARAKDPTEATAPADTNKAAPQPNQAKQPETPTKGGKG